MKDEAKNRADGTSAVPTVVDRAAFQAELDALRVREKAHTREGDAIAAARRRLPMVEVDASLALTGPRGPLTLLEAFEGRRQLIAYYFMWHAGHPAAEQCEGCTWVTTQVTELSYLHSRDITYAVFCQGPYDESARYRDFMGWEVPWYSAQASLATLLSPLPKRPGRMHLVCYLRDGDRVFETYWTTLRGVEVMDNSYALMDLTVYGRQERWENSPPAGCNSAPTSGLTAARPIGHQWQHGPADAPSPSGRAWKPGAPTTLAPAMRVVRTEESMADSAAGEESDYNTKIIKEFRANQGRVGGPWEGIPLILIHHVGARSGIERVTPVAYHPQPGGWFAIWAANGGSPTHPNWYHNLKAHPRITAEIGPQAFTVVAQELDGIARAELWAKLVAVYPQLAEAQARTTRQIPVLILTRQD